MQAMVEVLNIRLSGLLSKFIGPQEYGALLKMEPDDAPTELRIVARVDDAGSSCWNKTLRRAPAPAAVT